MILEKIKKEQKVARLKRDKFRAGVLTTLMAEVGIVGKNKQRETTDDEALVVITKFLKNLKETFKIYTKGYIELDDWYSTSYSAMGHSAKELDKIQDMLKESKIYVEFLPQQMSKEEIERKLGIFLGDNSNAQMGQIMGHFSKNFKGQYDGKVLSDIARETI